MIGILGVKRYLGGYLTLFNNGKLYTYFLVVFILLVVVELFWKLLMLAVKEIDKKENIY